MLIDVFDSGLVPRHLPRGDLTPDVTVSVEDVVLPAVAVPRLLGAATIRRARMTVVIATMIATLAETVTVLAALITGMSFQSTWLLALKTLANTT